MHGFIGHIWPPMVDFYLAHREKFTKLNDTNKIKFTVYVNFHFIFFYLAFTFFCWILMVLKKLLELLMWPSKNIN